MTNSENAYMINIARIWLLANSWFSHSLHSKHLKEKWNRSQTLWVLWLPFFIKLFCLFWQTHTKRHHTSVITFMASGGKNSFIFEGNGQVDSMSNIAANPVLHVKLSCQAQVTSQAAARTMQSED